MKYPVCPDCNHRFSFFDSLKNANPWNYKCPHCAAKIIVSTFWKVLTVIGFFIGAAMGGFALYQEKTGTWETLSSLLFILTCIAIALIASSVIWGFVTFKSEPKE